MSVPPDKRHLQALAGWAISAKMLASDEQALALGHFGDACGRLSQVIDCLPVYQKEEPSEATPAVFHYSTSDFSPMPIEVQQHLGVAQADGTCNHKFGLCDVDTQW